MRLSSAVSVVTDTLWDQLLSPNKSLDLNASRISAPGAQPLNLCWVHLWAAPLLCIPLPWLSHSNNSIAFTEHSFKAPLCVAGPFGDSATIPSTPNSHSCRPSLRAFTTTPPRQHGLAHVFATPPVFVDRSNGPWNQSSLRSTDPAPSARESPMDPGVYWMVVGCLWAAHPRQSSQEKGKDLYVRQGALSSELSLPASSRLSTRERVTGDTKPTLFVNQQPLSWLFKINL